MNYTAVHEGLLDLADLLKLFTRNDNQRPDSFSERELYVRELNTKICNSLKNSAVNFEWFIFTAETTDIGSLLFGSRITTKTLGFSVGELNATTAETEKFTNDLNQALGGDNFSRIGKALVCKVPVAQASKFLSRLEINSEKLAEVAAQIKAKIAPAKQVQPDSSSQVIPREKTL